MENVKKGDVVYHVGSYDCEGITYYQHIEITAAGPKVIRARDVVTGDMLEEELSPGASVENMFEHLESAALHAAGMAQKDRARIRLHYAQGAANMDAGPQYRAAMQKDLDRINNLPSPSVHEYHAARAISRAKWEASRRAT